MHPSVLAAWINFNTPLEGLVRSLYADVLGLVTTGMGNLVDPVGAALVLPWKRPDGSPATQAQIAAAWNAVKNDPRCAKLGWVYAQSLPGNDIRLDDADVAALVYSKLKANDRLMAARFADWESRPADAQMAAHSMAWAMGPSFWPKFPRFTALFTAGDYGRIETDAKGNPIVRGAAGECAISPPHGTIIVRNAHNKQMLLNAAKVAADPSADRSILIGP